MKRMSLVVVILLFIGLLSLQISPIFAVSYNFTVDDDGDDPDANTTDGVCDTGAGVCTLRAALHEANDLLTAADTVTIDFDTGIDQINIATDLQVIASGTYIINGAGVTVDNTGTGRVFSISSATITINGLTITGGDGSAGYGAGIYVYDATLSLNDVLITGNDAGANWGGGIYLEIGSGAELIVDNSTISHNNAAYGGGIYVDEGTTALLQNGTIVTQNTATNSGAGILSSGDLTVTDSAITYNNGLGQGDGIRFTQGGSPASVQVNNSCIVCNGNDAVDGTIPSDFSNNWWGTAAGPYYASNAQGLQCSTGDSLSNSNTLADYGISVATSGTCAPGPLATGNWLTATTAGCTGSEIQEVSSIGHARTCQPPP